MHSFISGAICLLYLTKSFRTKILVLQKYDCKFKASIIFANNLRQVDCLTSLKFELEFYFNAGLHKYG